VIRNVSLHIHIQHENNKYHIIIKIYVVASVHSKQNKLTRKFTIMENRILIYLFLVSFVYTLNAKSYFEDYCWREYDGNLPSDAAAFGLDSRGKPVYIGQVLYEGKLIPGQIYTNDRNIYFEWKENAIATYENVKILCTQHMDKFEWVQTEHNKVVFLTNKILIKGGYQPEWLTYIGKKEVNGVTYLGKVICGPYDCYGLYTTNDGRTSLDTSFQILTYKQ
ncbi:hypothetical protein ILUMI_00500, partial [Ignelater luminosus]